MQRARGWVSRWCVLIGGVLLLVLAACGSSGSGKAKLGTCPEGGNGAHLVPLPAPDGSTFCMAADFVTQAQYAAFVVAKKGDMSGQPPICANNPSYEIPQKGDDTGTQFCPIEIYDPVKKGDYPMECAHWCDAYMYCQWAGMRLCGKVGGGAIPWGGDDPLMNANQSEWYAACTQGKAATKYPYGNDDDPSCDVSANETNEKVASMPQCDGKGPFAAVHRLTGLLMQFEDQCSNVDGCATRGASYYGKPVSVKAECGIVGQVSPYGEYGSGSGIRCCADSN